MKSVQKNILISIRPNLLSLLLTALILLVGMPDTGKAQNDDSTPVDTALYLTGDKLSRYDFYGAKGNQAGQVFGQLGKQWYHDLAFTLSQQPALGRKWALEFVGVHNNSLYRSFRWGSELERLRFTYERGDTSLPYRFEAGDIYGNFSYRTLQRSLRGFIVDLQPSGGGDGRHSIQFLYGVAHPDWHDIVTPFDRTFGLSWLWQEGDATRMSLNYVRNYREGDAFSGTLDRDQSVFSFAGERKTSSGRHPMIIEAEIARFEGDHDGLTGAASGQNRQEMAFFAQISGGSRPFTYRLRHELTGQDFRPVGGNVSPDRRSWETYSAWDLGRGRHLNARWQAYRNGWETDNPLDSRIFGMGVRGPVDDAGRWQGGIDAFVETSDNTKGTTDSRTRSIVGDLSRAFSPAWSGRFTLSHRMFDDRINDASDQRVTQMAVGIDHTTKIVGWNGRAGLDLENRLIDAGGERSREFSPALSLSLAKDNQSLSANYRFQRQDQVNPVRLDIDTAQAGLRYQICSGKNTFGLEYLSNRREDTNGIWARSYQITAFWQYAFDEVWTRPIPVRTGESAAGTAAAPDALTAINLSDTFASAVAALDQLTGTPARRWGELAIADHKMFNDIPQRQRLVIEPSDEKVKRAVLVIDVDGSVAGQVGDVLDRARRTLIERYGTPTEVDERGNYGPGLAERHRAGLFARTTQWVLPGGILRLGLPRRLDGRLRVEIHWSENMGRLRDPIWGLELLE